MLTNVNKRKLKALANTIKNRYQIGKNGITNTSLDLLDKALTAHELIKIDVLKANTSPVNEIAFDLASKLNADIVAIIGRVITLYRYSLKDGVKHLI